MRVLFYGLNVHFCKWVLLSVFEYVNCSCGEQIRDIREHK